MPWLRDNVGPTLFAFLLLVPAPVHAAPPPAVPKSVPAKPVAAAPSPALPDYGGRDAAPLGGTGDGVPNPAAQAGHALEALVVVLAGAAGVVYALKRFGLVQPGVDGRPARIALPLTGRAPGPAAGAASTPIAVESSQALPGGAMLHVVSTGGRTFLLAATPHTVTRVAEWPVEGGSGQEAVGDANFADYLDRADAAPLMNPQADASSRVVAANARLRSLLDRTQGEDRP
jgi:hypothetical protein